MSKRSRSGVEGLLTRDGKRRRLEDSARVQPSSSESTSGAASSSSSSSSSLNIVYTFFKFDVDVKKEEVTIPHNVAQSLPVYVDSARISAYLPKSFERKQTFFMFHEKCLAFHMFTNQEACSKKDGKYSQMLGETMLDRARKPDGYIKLPELGNLRAAEVYDGGNRYQESIVRSYMEGDEVHITYKDTLRPIRPGTPLTERQKTANLVGHLEAYFTKEELPLGIVTPKADVNLCKLCRFSGGGDLAIMSSNGPVVIGGGPTIDPDKITPLKEGNVATTTCVENKVATNTQSYLDVERQLFANMHLSSCEALISGLMHKDVDPNSIDCMIAYGTILKPGSNLVALYKLVAPFNKDTYIQVDFMTETIYWHSAFDRVLQYTFNKLVI